MSQPKLTFVETHVRPQALYPVEGRTIAVAVAAESESAFGNQVEVIGPRAVAALCAGRLLLTTVMNSDGSSTLMVYRYLSDTPPAAGEEAPIIEVAEVTINANGRVHCVQWW